MAEEPEELEELEESEVLTTAEIESYVAESSLRLQESTGHLLPRLSTPLPVSKGFTWSATLGIELPLGNLFYPCCGSDIDDAISSFGSCVQACHFADPYNPPGRRSSRHVEWRTLSIPHVEWIVMGPQKRWRLPHSGCEIHVHRKDGLLTLLEDVQDLSVFYYRGDMTGEGGSNQLWLNPVLFHAVLAKLLDGGMVATDGSNCGNEGIRESVPWSPICAGTRGDGQFELRRA